MIPLPLGGRACAARLAAAEFNAHLSHLPTATKIAPVTVTAGCASIVPLANVETPGSNTMPPTMMRTFDMVDTTFGCLAIM